MVTYNGSSSSFLELLLSFLCKRNCGLEKYSFVQGWWLAHGRNSRMQLEGQYTMCISIPLMLKKQSLSCPLGVAVRNLELMAQTLAYD